MEVAEIAAARGGAGLVQELRVGVLERSTSFHQGVDPPPFRAPPESIRIDFGTDADPLMERSRLPRRKGVDFDPINGRHCVRFSFAGSTPDMAEACERLALWKK